MFPRRGLGEERAEAIIIGRWGAFDEATIGLDKSDQRKGKRITGERNYTQTVFDSVEFPCEYELAPIACGAWRGRTAGVSNLDTGLTDVDRDDFTHDLRWIGWKGGKDERGDARRRVEDLLERDEDGDRDWAEG